LNLDWQLCKFTRDALVFDFAAFAFSVGVFDGAGLGIITIAHLVGIGV
jgi:hypothetical protein